MTEERKQRLREALESLLEQPLPAPRSLAEIEQQALDMQEKMKQAFLEESLREAQTQVDAEHPEESKISCPDCQKSAWYKGDRSKNVVTMAGKVTFSRRYYYCHRCDKGFYPQDVAWSMPQGTLVTVSVQQKLVALSVGFPFAQASEIFFYLTNLRVSTRSTERLCVHQAGEQAERYYEVQQSQMLPLAYVPLSSLPDDLPTPEILYLEADGIHTPLKGGHYKEMKVGVARSTFFDGREDEATGYVSHLGDATTFGACWERLAISRGYLQAKVVVVLGDGATWLWNVADSRFPRAIQILDFWHALEYVGKVARDAFGDDTVRLKAWFSHRALEMQKSNWSAFYSSLELIRPFLGSNTDSFENLLRYFKNNASRMDYASYLKRGFSIGSGLAESSCKRIVTARLKCSGMHWSEKGAQAMARLRGLFLGGDWNAFLNFWNQSMRMPISSPLL
jgi:hypothetical protein